MKNWSHKVVKMSLGTDGKYFARKASFTGNLDECEQYAAAFAAEQNTPTEMGLRLSGHRILVTTRKGGLTVRGYRVDSSVPAGESGEQMVYREVR